MRGIEAVSTQHQNYPPIFTTRGERVSRVWFYRFGRRCSSISPGNQAAVHFCAGISGRDQSSGSRKQEAVEVPDERGREEEKGEEERVEEGNADEQQNQ